MVKQRMTTADVAGEVASLKQRVLGMRVANIYDLNSKTYLLKLARSGEEGEKIFLLLESGTRFHTTQWVKDRSETPSNFTLKLRKHLRTRRLEAVRQLGVDRMVDFTFGAGETAYHLILELYSQGNVVLTDAKYEVLTLLRSHRDDARGFAIMARHPYPVHAVRPRTPLDEQALAEALANADAKVTLRGVLTSVMPYGPALADHWALSAGLAPQRSPAAAPLTEAERAALAAAVREWEAWLDACATQAPPGFITGKKQAAAGAAKQGSGPAGSQEAPSAAGAIEAAAEEEAGLVYEDFEPLDLSQHRGRPALRFDTFDAALDEFFAKVEGQKAAAQRSAQEAAALAKLERARQDQGQRVQGLGREAEDADNKAQLIEYNLEAVDAAIAAVREALAAGLDWRELGRMIKEERRAGNPVAGLIDSLQLEAGRITLLLSNWLDDEEDDDEALTRPASRVEVQIDLNAYANARLHFEARKARLEKQQKTLDASERALKAAEKKAQAALSQVQAVAAVQRVRKPLWFERFNWFISSENYLVLSGRDAQQNELLVKRYLKPGDVYVHAELHGAASTIVKNAAPAAPIPPLTLSQAGTACVCRSAAWDAKVVTSAWWVHAHQVSKTAPSGEYLPTGSFIIRGRKNFLPPTQLIMGFGFLFKLDEESIPGHLGERAPKSLDPEADASQNGGAEPPAGSSRPQTPPAAAPSKDHANGRATPAEEDRGQAGSSTPPETDADRQAAEAAGVLDDGESEDDSEEGSESGGDAGEQSAGSGGSGEGSGDQQEEEAGPLGVEENSALAAFMDGAADALDSRGLNYSRYGLAAAAAAAEPATEEGSSSSAAPSPPGPGKRHLSAKERKLLKKGIPLSESASNMVSMSAVAGPSADGAGDGIGEAGGVSGRGESGQHESAAQLEEARRAERERREAKAAAAERASQQAAATAARGKRAKAKKAKERYGEQDEEDRQLAMQLLASAGSRKEKKDKKEARKARRDARQGGAAPLPPRVQREGVTAEALARIGITPQEAQPRRDWQARPNKGTQAAPSTAQPASRDEPDQAGPRTPSPGLPEPNQAPQSAEDGTIAEPDEESGTSDGDDDGAAVVAEEGQTEAERAEVAALLAEENLEVLTEEERDRLTVLDSLTGQPRAGDVLLAALPVCAPYNVLAGYKLRLKLIPGTQRKGKAGRQAVEILSRAADITPRERELLKAAPEMDIINAMLGNVKISTPGLQKLKNEQRRNKKKG